MEKQLITYKGTPIRLSADFSAETLQAIREQHDIPKVMKGEKTSKQEYSTRQSSHSHLKEKSKTKRIQHHSTSFTTNAKGTCLGRKEKATTTNKKIINDKAHQQRHAYSTGTKSSTYKYATKTRNREKRKVHIQDAGDAF